jgi:hypothetical protein
MSPNKAIRLGSEAVSGFASEADGLVADPDEGMMGGGGGPLLIVAAKKLS